MLRELKPVAEKAGMEGDWRIARTLPKDIGERPALDTLGPEAWQPPPAPMFTVTTAKGDEINSDEWDGKPRVVIFYLGFGCLHCVEQLKTFVPKLEEFAAAGIEVVAISTEDIATLSKGIVAFGEPIPIPLFADPEQEAFKSYRCWDDFESLPLHGTFLIDAAGRVRWQDIGAEPFNDVEFLLKESARLLSLTD
jgi:peroxiredoxin